MKNITDICIPVWMQETFETRRQAAHEANVSSLRKAMKRREYLRGVLMLAGFLLLFCGAGAIEFSAIYAGAIAAMVGGIGLMGIAGLILKGDEW